MFCLIISLNHVNWNSFIRLSDYGLPKLEKLLEAIPSVVEVFEKSGKLKVVRLKQAEPETKPKAHLPAKPQAERVLVLILFKIGAITP